MDLKHLNPMFALTNTYVSVSICKLKEGWDCFGVGNRVLNGIDGPCSMEQFYPP